MAFKLIKIVFLAIFILGMAQLSNAQSNKERARNNLRKWGIAYCISQSMEVSETDTISGYAQVAYFELGAHKGEAYEVIKKYIGEYAK